MSMTKTVKYYSDALEKIFWKGYEFHNGSEARSLKDMVIDLKPIAISIGIDEEFVLKWIHIVQKEMSIKL